MLTDDQTVDVLTKPLPRTKFEYFRERLGVEENASLLEREAKSNIYLTSRLVPLIVLVLRLV